MAKNKDKISANGSDTILFAHKAFQFLENQQYDEALSLCEAGVKRFPFYAEGHFILGKCYQTLKKYNEAKNEYERTLVFMPGHIRAMSALAYIYYKMDLAPKANDLLIQAVLYNPFNKDLIGYLKAENLYNSLYPISETILPSSDKKRVAQSAIDIDIKDDVTRELISEINGSEQESFQEAVSDVSEEVLEPEIDGINADDLVAYNITDNEMDDSNLRLDDSEITDYDLGSISDKNDTFSDEIEINIDSDEISGELNMIESELNDITEHDIRDSEAEPHNIEDSAIDDSFLDDSFISDNSNDEFYLETETADKDNEDDEITRIDEYVSTKDEITELSIDQYEVNSIVDNIVESDLKEDTKTDLSKFANTEDDFSSLMNGIFEEREVEEDDEEFPEGHLEDFDEDETQIAEERPILDTSIIFMDREKPEELELEHDNNQTGENQLDIEDSLGQIEEGIELGTDENEDFGLKIDDDDIEIDNLEIEDKRTDFTELGDDDISKVIEEIEKKGDKLISQEEEDISEVSDHPQVVPLPAIDNENANIDEILNNPKMLTSTFGEILIAQKKFSDAKRVFSELSKKDPNNNNLKRKIEFLNKLVKFEK